MYFIVLAEAVIIRFLEIVTAQKGSLAVTVLIKKKVFFLWKVTFMQFK